MRPLGHALLAFPFLVVLGTGVAGAQTKINGCTTITASGSYVLTKDITASTSNLIPNASFGLVCLVIAADFVTLDMAEHTITGPGPGNGANGITDDSCCSRQAITVRSGSVTNFANNGIVLTGAGMTVEHVRAIGNGNRGIEVGHALAPLGPPNGHRVVGNIALSNGTGIQVSCPAVVLQNVAEKNTPPPAGGDIIVDVGCTLADNSPPP